MPMKQKKPESRVIFTKEMKQTHTILLPSMLPIHFEMIKNIFIECGYKAVLLDNQGPEIASVGLKYVHNDTCYPALLVIGQMIDALQSGKYDPDRTALMITQTGGGCRASNYIHLLRKALKRAGFPQVPVVSLNMSGMEKNPGFTLDLAKIRKAAAALIYGDILMLLSNQVRPYEKNAGETDRLLSQWIQTISDLFRRGKGAGYRQIKKIMALIAEQFEAVPVVPREKIKVGIVGEIYMKYAGLGNNQLEQFLREQDCEVMVPGLLAFMLFAIDNNLEDVSLYGGGAISSMAVKALLWYLQKIESALIEAVQKTRFTPPGRYQHTKTLVDGIVSRGSKMGEGWLLPAEMVELVEMGYPNIVCAQPFGCLPNHINGRGMMNRIKEKHPGANIVAIDYDPGAARVNQENRIKLMLASARDTLAQTAESSAEETLVTVAQVLPELASKR